MIINEFDLNNKIIILTGSEGFLAQNFIKAILNHNGRLILMDKKKKRNYSNKKIKFFKCNLTSENDVKKVFLKIKANFGDPDVLINNAALNPSTKEIKYNNFSLENFSKSYWDKDLNNSLTSAFLCTKYFGRLPSKKKRCIINVSSDLGLIAPNQSIYERRNKKKLFKPVSYSVVKHGIIGLTKYTSTIWNKKNIRCNTVAFGGVYKNQQKSFVKRISKLIPMGRMAKENEYNSTIIYLASDASSYMNGATIVIDGGRTAW